MKTSTRKAPALLMGAALVAIGIATTAGAASLDGQIALRPLTPQDIVDHKLTGLQGASGLNTIGLGQPAYLEALLSLEIPGDDVTNVTWAVSSAPIGSTAALSASPLGATVPTYKMADRLSCQVAGRTVLRPDVAGQYTVTATIETASNGSTNLSQTITAGTYMGVDTCALCHSGGTITHDKLTPWAKTAHAGALTRGLEGISSDHYSKNCISCHTVGYDVNTNAVNGGFDDVVNELGWAFPTNMVPGNWDALPDKLKNVGNIQCESCHGPGSQHAFSLGDPEKISVSYAAGDCAQCHNSGTHHVKSAEWNNSAHAIAPVEAEAGCAKCHSAPGFANFAKGLPAEEVHFEVITCSACHDPHDAANPHQLRTVAPVTLLDKKTVISEGGLGLMCMNCHMSRRDAVTYAETTAGSTRFGPHHGPQSDMLVGANAVTYGKQIPSSAHRDVVEDSCVTCHMQAGVAATNAAFAKVGGHTFKVGLAASGTNAPVHLVGACVECHGEIESFDFQRQDYDGNGVVDGVQTEVKGLLNKLALLLPPVGTPKSALAIDKNWTRPQLKAAYNYQFVLEDGSFGVHNLSYAVGLLKASLADLTGDANNDNLPDSWQINYFGSVDNPNAAPNAMPTGDGVPNWLKCSLGLDPTVPGVAMPNGVVWMNGKNLVNPPIDPSATNTVAIYTAAEVVFNTEVGKTYQVQAASSVSSGWQNVSESIVGTGQPVSYVTPTRTGVQQFYRVSHD